MPLPSPLATLGPATTVLVVLADVVLILAVAAGAGRVARRLGQPAVVGEILGGIALGPSLLGLLSADLPGTLFPDDARPALEAIATVGLVLFMFGVGRDADPGLLRRAGGRIGVVATGSIAIPALVGALVALPLWADHAVVDGQAVPRTAFVAFVATALSVTAFPVLARMLDEAEMLRGRLGGAAMAVAAVTDLAAWSALAVVVALHGAGDRSLAVLLLGLPVCVAVFLLVVRPAVTAALRRTGGAATPALPGADGAGAAGLAAGGAAADPVVGGEPGAESSPSADHRGPAGTRTAAALVLAVGLALTATATDVLGLHAAIGAFAFGLASPRRGAAGLAADRGAAVLGRAGLLLVPVFFLTTGLGVDLARIGSAGLTELAILLVAATGAKFAGVAGAARVAGMGGRDAVVLGTLLNARGLTELVVLEVGRSAGIIDERTFAALVAVALITTVAAGAVFRRLATGDDRPRAAVVPRRGSRGRPRRTGPDPPSGRASKRADGRCAPATTDTRVDLRTLGVPPITRRRVGADRVAPGRYRGEAVSELLQEQATTETPEGMIAVENPATGETISFVENMSAARIDELVARARAVQPAWQALGYQGRRRLMLALRHWMVTNRSRVVDVVVAENGKTREDALLAELFYVADSMGFWAKNAGKYLADEKVRTHSPLVLGRKVKVTYRPLGVVGVVAPWNYPLTLGFGDALPALMAGNSVIIKPSEITPLATQLMAEAAEEVGFPAGVFQVATGDGATGSALVDRADMIMFTGSTKTGRKIGARCGERLIPCSLELGGKDPMIVLDDADLERAANVAVEWGMRNSGQICMSVERVYVEAPVYDEFVEKVEKKVRALRQGAPEGFGSVDVGAITFPPQIETISRHVDDAVAKGARVLVGGKRGTGQGRFYEPTVLVDVDHTMDCMTEETFGPTLPIMKVADEDEGIRLANDVNYGLGSSVFSKDVVRGERVARRINAGVSWVNDAIMSYMAQEAPFGGAGESGVGNRHGKTGIRKYTQTHTILVTRFMLRREPTMFPNTKLGAKLLDRLMVVMWGRKPR